LSVTETLFFLTACKTYWILKYGNGEPNSMWSNWATLSFNAECIKKLTNTTKNVKNYDKI